MKVNWMKIGERNVGPFDRFVRIIVGIVLIAIAVLGWVTVPWVYLIALIGVILLITGIVGWCQLYTILGINTLKKKA